MTLAPLLPEAASPTEVVAALRHEGYAVVPGLLEPARLAEARAELASVLPATPFGRQGFEGEHTRRVYALFAKCRAFDAVATAPLVLAVLDEVLREYHLSAPVAIEVCPGEHAQALHTDDILFPVPVPHDPIVVNVMFPLDDFTAENGATRIVPRSHLFQHSRPPDEELTVPVEMAAGSAMFFLGSLWHGGGANRTSAPRLGTILHYSVAWLRPIENHVLAVPREVVQGLEPRLQELLGYNVCSPFIGYVDGRHPRKVLS